MPRVTFAAVLSLTVLLPLVGTAQVGSRPPEVTAAGAAWQANDEPIFVNGLQFLPTRAFRIFDAQTMTRIAGYQGVPIYVDATLEPNTVVYVPVGGMTMRVYEHPREGELAGTTGSRVPFGVPAVVVPEAPVGTAGTVPPAVATETETLPAVPPRRAQRPVETTLRPQGNIGIWIEYAGARYYSDGHAAVYRPDRFQRIGEYRGFPVYRAVDDSKKDRIWVTSAQDGPVAPFVKR
ncbi:MAG TPA: hypothetical protein VEU08_23190 [Vicinamibacterales bacterium]|nr:hypothetical protein [Vicinamibacterales bacterium]